MKRQKKQKPKKMQAKRQPRNSVKAPSLWDQTLREAAALATRAASPQTPAMPVGEFTAGELGQPDSDVKPDSDNPGGVQGGRGPLNEEGEGDRQNDELAELEMDIDAKKDLDQRR